MRTNPKGGVFGLGILDSAERRGAHVASRVRKGELIESVLDDISDVFNKDLRHFGIRASSATRKTYRGRIRERALHFLR